MADVDMEMNDVLRRHVYSFPTVTRMLLHASLHADAGLSLWELGSLGMRPPLPRYLESGERVLELGERIGLPLIPHIVYALKP